MMRRWRWAAPIVPLLLAGCVHFDAFDRLCIKGRLSQQQADVVNALPWNNVPGYCSEETLGEEIGKPREDQRTGRVPCRVEAEDRILASQCSEFLKRLGGD